MAHGRNYQFTVGDMTYNLRFNYSAILMVEEQTGKSFTDIVQGFISRNVNFGTLKLLLEAGLKLNHPNVNVMDILDSDHMDIGDVAQVVVNAINAGMSKKSMNPDPQPAPPPVN